MQKEYSTKLKALVITLYTLAVGFLGTTLAPYLQPAQKPVGQVVTPSPVVTAEVTVSASPSATVVPSKASSKAYFTPVAKPSGN